MWTCPGQEATLLLGGAMLDLTAFKCDGRVDLSWAEATLLLGGAVLDITAFKWEERVDLS